MFWFNERNRSNLFDTFFPASIIKERESEYNNWELPIAFANHETGKIANRLVINYSEHGLYIELDHGLIVRTGALVYMTEHSIGIDELFRLFE